MQYRQLGSLFRVSALTLGGGGIGQVWGQTDRAEAIAVVQAALEAGITYLDLAPLYGEGGEAEKVVAEAMGGAYPQDIKINTKCMLGNCPANEVLDRLEESLDGSCARLKSDKVDTLVLHGYIIEDGWSQGPRTEMLPYIAMQWSLYEDHIIPALQTLVKQGRIQGWGITSGPKAMTEKALQHFIKPDIIQCVTNLLNSSGNMDITGVAEDPKSLVEMAQSHGIGVMGVRAVAAGALCQAFDRDVNLDSPEAQNFERASGFRKFANDLEEVPAVIAHRYALSMQGVDTVVLGVKNRTELKECLGAEKSERYSAMEMEHIIGSVS